MILHAMVDWTGVRCNAGPEYDADGCLGRSAPSIRAVASVSTDAKEGLNVDTRGTSLCINLDWY